MSGDLSLEPERYEQWERPRYRFETSRRDFLRALGGGLLVTALLSASNLAAAGRPRSSRDQGHIDRDEIGAWLRIGPDGTVTVYTGKVQVGQGIRTSLAQIVAEELAVAVDRLQMVMGDTALTPYDRGTHGSQSTPQMGSQLRLVAATTRGLLLDLAAKQWGVATHGLRLEDGAVVDPEGSRRLALADLATGRLVSAEVEHDIAVTPPSRWEVVGTPVRNVDSLAIVTGKQRFVSDVSLPGLVHGRVLRAPSYAASLVSLDSSAAQALPGVRVVRDGDFVGVVAPDEHRAAEAVGELRASWRETDQPDSDELFDHLLAHPLDRRGWRGRREQQDGSVSGGLSAAQHRVKVRYTLPYIAHAPLEPRAAVACWVGDKLLVWVGTQHPFPVRDDLASAFGLPRSEVRVRVPPTGSGYGGKHTSEVAIEAARLARAAGAPVKLIWTREEEFTWAYFRPAGVMDLRAGVDKHGRLVAWEHVNYNSGSSAIETPYVVDNRRIVFQPTDSPVRQGSYRALAATANHFARESVMDEAAHAAGVDPLRFRRDHLEDDRLREVLDRAANRFGWNDAKSTDGRGVGLAIGKEKGGYVATVAEVSVHGDSVRVMRLVTAFDCGAINNPDNLRNQIEGAVIMGLGGALFEAIELRGGTVANPRFSSYRVPRFTDVPELETILIDRQDRPSAGAGETPIVGVAPAIANAIFAVTGRRIRRLPLTPDGRLPSV